MGALLPLAGKKWVTIGVPSNERTTVSRVAGSGSGRKGEPAEEAGEGPADASAQHADQQVAPEADRADHDHHHPHVAGHDAAVRPDRTRGQEREDDCDHDRELQDRDHLALGDGRGQAVEGRLEGEEERDEDGEGHREWTFARGHQRAEQGSGEGEDLRGDAAVALRRAAVGHDHQGADSEDHGGQGEGRSLKAQARPDVAGEGEDREGPDPGEALPGRLRALALEAEEHAEQEDGERLGEVLLHAQGQAYTRPLLRGAHLG